jgi:hypothetical protein
LEGGPMREDLSTAARADLESNFRPKRLKDICTGTREGLSRLREMVRFPRLIG